MQIENYRRVDKGSLTAFFDLLLPSGLQIRGMKLFSGDKGRWVRFPSKEYLNKDGEKKYSNIVDIADRDTADKFFTKVLAALEPHLASSKAPSASSQNTDDIPF